MVGCGDDMEQGVRHREGVEVAKDDLHAISSVSLLQYIRARGSNIPRL